MYVYYHCTCTTAYWEGLVSTYYLYIFQIGNQNQNERGHAYNDNITCEQGITKVSLFMVDTAIK